MSEILVIKCQRMMRPDKLSKFHENIRRQVETDVVVLPPGFEAVVVPDNIEIKMEVSENEN